MTCMKLNLDLARDRMVLTAARWLPERGMAALNLIEIGRAAEAPRGSLYHYFPGGRDQLMQEALALACDSGLRMIAKAAVGAESASHYLCNIFAIGGTWLNAEDYSGGCPIAAAVLSTQTEGPAVQHTLRDAFQQWEAALCTALAGFGLQAPDDAEVARGVLIAFEGAMLHAKGARSMAAFQTAGRMALGLLPAALPHQLE
jgi:TetR/AcrR family transcriptional repressor of lmrAB and yxaGH operons